MEEETNKTCANCLLCIKTYAGCECRLTDNQVDESQTACIDYINNGDDEQ